jgi:hypothetical protein
LLWFLFDRFPVMDVEWFVARLTLCVGMDWFVGCLDLDLAEVGEGKICGSWMEGHARCRLARNITLLTTTKKHELG